ncbi:glycerophosphodiester phosphodiesterase family protein [Williamsia sp. CHRR-6]|uniref:glycerophosphodiester phosphodiesterase family protein n=1 Tax=Williamsia sp. CHRR-6 TaxID=2835871 RepID=UPI001BDA4FCD|nr:glycerophosphodiester phosphodiesterase family protein [Williamsia sp. CHRR-6]MBT0566652.1 glycerophosphodiester phosphodiesterase [Williamsia sp. CHRR-6]
MHRARLLSLTILTLIVSQALLITGPASAQPGPSPRSFDLQAHRGGIGLTTESTLAAFDKALRLGVSTLELDTQVTRDLKVVVSHDRQISRDKCRDTAPATVDDQQFPYVGKYIKDLTLAQITTLDCGYRRLTDFPDQEQISGARIIELRELFALIRSRHARHVMMNIETKVEAGAPEQTMPREVFVRRVYAEIARSGLRRQVTIQSFDWGALTVMHRLDRRIPLVALTNRDFLQVGQPGRSPWLGGIDADDFGGDLVRSALSVPGLRAISPVQGFPQNGRFGNPDFTPYPDAQMVADAHRAGLKVIPWTVDDPATMAYFVDLGVDGLITNYPDRLREVLGSRGIALPRPVLS